VAAGILAGCAKEQKEASQAASEVASASAAGWQSALPPALAAFAVKDGGACYLDAIDGAPIASNPIRIKSGSPVAMAGWAVADLKAGVLGRSVGIQLNAATSYSIPAASYEREGLGEALKKPSLGGGGLMLNSTPLSIPAGYYRVLFLVQSGSDLLRCDTGRDILVE
jgi:hypothetical protein